LFDAANHHAIVQRPEFHGVLSIVEVLRRERPAPVTQQVVEMWLSLTN
jgi:hypothetical protein